LGDKSKVAKTLHKLGMAHHVQGKYTSAVYKYMQSLDIAQRIGDNFGVAQTSGQLGLMLDEQGDLSAALEKLEQAKVAFGQVGARRELAITEDNIDRIRSKMK
jgi:tetratricopeptide (TPR) repeat protein